MNERIRLLAKQAKLKTELWNNPEPFVIYKEDVNYPGGLEKFAYLIIRECRDIVGKTRDQAIEEEWNVDEAMSTAMFDIEDYFGVK